MLLLVLASALAGEPCLDAGGKPAESARNTGISWAQQGNFDKALPCFEAAVTVDTASASDWFNLGSVYTDLAGEQDDDDAAMKYISSAVDAVNHGLGMSGAPAMLIDMHARNLFILDKREHALKLIEITLPGVEEPLLRERLIDTYGEFAREPVPDKYKAYAKQFQAGSDLVSPSFVLADRPAEVDGKSLNKGIKKLRKAVDLYPHSWAAWWMLGMALQADDSDEQALIAFQRAYEVNPVHVEVSKQLVFTHLRSGTPAKATASDAAVAMHPNNPEVVSNHALVCLMRGNTPEARRWIDHARSLDPNDPITRALEQRISGVEAGTADLPSVE